MKIIGHKGASGEAPENSFSAINKAYALDLDMFQVDVQLTADGVPVIFHDNNLLRCANTDQLIANVDAAYLAKSVRLENGEAIPTLRELCELNKGRRQKIILELRHPKSTAIVYNVLRKYDMEQFIVSSFFHKAIYYMKQLQPVLKTAAVFKCCALDLVEFIAPLKCEFVSIGIESAHKEMVRTLKTIPVECFAWPVNNHWDYHHAVDIGIDGIMTNYPSEFIGKNDTIRKVIEGGGK